MIEIPTDVFLSLILVGSSVVIVAFMLSHDYGVVTQLKADINFYKPIIETWQHKVNELESQLEKWKQAALDENEAFNKYVYKANKIYEDVK